MSKKFDIKAEVTQTIIDALEEGVAPWVKPWDAGAGYPVNGHTGRAYNGMNILLLLAAQQRGGYSDNRWVTFKQAKKCGGNVKKGEKSTMVVFWRMLRKEEEKDDGTTEQKVIPLLRYYRVFNWQQCENMPEGEAEEQSEIERHEAADAAIDSTGAAITYGHTRACYIPSKDRIELPDPWAFEDDASFYSTAFHELGHWTGHESRLDRDLCTSFGSEDYAKEELVAELTAAYCCAELGVDGHLQHPEYIGHWIKALKNDTHLIFWASSRAKKAADYILPEEESAAAQEAA